MLSTCQIDLYMGSLDHVQNDLPFVSAAQGGDTGKVDLFCPLYNTSDEDSFSSDDTDHWGHWELIARDPDGGELKHDVLAQLHTYSRTNNGSDTISTLSSSLSTGTSIGNMTKYVEDIDEHTFDFRNLDYLITITVVRQNAADFAAGRSIQFCPGKS